MAISADLQYYLGQMGGQNQNNTDIILEWSFMRFWCLSQSMADNQPRPARVKVGKAIRLGQLTRVRNSNTILALLALVELTHACSLTPQPLLNSSQLAKYFLYVKPTSHMCQKVSLYSQVRNIWGFSHLVHSKPEKKCISFAQLVLFSLYIC